MVIEYIEFLEEETLVPICFYFSYNSLPSKISGSDHLKVNNGA